MYTLNWPSVSVTPDDTPAPATPAPVDDDPIDTARFRQLVQRASNTSAVTGENMTDPTAREVPQAPTLPVEVPVDDKWVTSPVFTALGGLMVGMVANYYTRKKW